MALSTLLRKPILIKDLCLKPVQRSWTSCVINNLNHESNRAVVSRHQSQFLQQIKKFSTSRTLLSSHGGDHSTLWTVEKAVTIAILGLIPACIAVPSKAIDTITAVLMTMHMHWGLQAITSDYIRKAVFGPTIPKIAAVLVYVLSVVTLAGLLNLTYNQAGIGNTIRCFWRLRGIQGITTDYIRKSVFGPTIPRITAVMVYVLSAVTLAGLLNLIFNQCGLGNAIAYFWRMDRKGGAAPDDDDAGTCDPYVKDPCS